MTETLAGQAMKACLKPLYQQAYQGTAYTPLGEALLDAIDTMIMRHVKPSPFLIRNPGSALC